MRLIELSERLPIAPAARLDDFSAEFAVAQKNHQLTTNPLDEVGLGFFKFLQSREREGAVAYAPESAFWMEQECVPGCCPLHYGGGSEDSVAARMSLRSLASVGRRRWNRDVQGIRR